MFYRRRGKNCRSVRAIGKAFRNEITPGHFIFRTREFEQMEQQYFINPKDKKMFEDLMATQEMVFGFGIKKKICVSANTRNTNWRISGAGV